MTSNYDKKYNIHPPKRTTPEWSHVAVAYMADGRRAGRRQRGREKENFLINLFPLIPACTARPGLPLSPPETAFLESPYYRPQTASIAVDADRHHPTNFHSVTYTQTDDAAFEAGSDNDHKSFLRMRVIFKVEYPAELFRFRRVFDDILLSFDVF